MMADDGSFIFHPLFSFYFDCISGYIPHIQNASEPPGVSVTEDCLEKSKYGKCHSFG